MCGLLGIVGKFNNEIEKKILSFQNELSYRGPDETKVINESNEQNKKIIFIHNRLSILDHKNGSQPMRSDDNSVIIFNGEIYNHNSLRDELKSNGVRFSTSSDTEVILKGYQNYGFKITEKLNGMWAFIIYDKNNDKIFVSRDRFGEKPLFYYLSEEFFIFSSEEWVIKKILSNIKLNFKNIAKYCALGFVPENLTPYENIYSLEPGFNIELSIKKMTPNFHRYWKFQIKPDYQKSEKYWIDSLYSALENSVKIRLNADTEVGTFLSGGLDSSIITYFAGKERKDLKTFSINFEDKEINERKYIDFFQKNILNTDHYDLEFKLENSQNLYKNFQNSSKELLSDSSLISYYALCKEASKKVKVVLGGDGSDELLAGYNTFKAISYYETMNKYNVYSILKFFSKLNKFFPSSHKNQSIKFLIDRFFKAPTNDLSLANPVWLSPLNLNLINKMLKTDYKNGDIYEEIINEWKKNKKEDVIDNTLYFYVNFFLKSQTLRKTDRIGMYNSLEIRSPFLDNEVIDIIRQIPHEFKFRNGTNKYILKKLALKIFPSKFVNRKKIGLTTPISKMIQSKKLEFKLDNIKNVDFEIDKFLDEQNKFSKDNRLELWNLKILDNFLIRNNEKL